MKIRFLSFVFTISGLTILNIGCNTSKINDEERFWSNSILKQKDNLPVSEPSLEELLEEKLTNFRMPMIRIYNSPDEKRQIKI